MTALVAIPNGVWLREAVAELKRTSRLPQFLVPTVVTPAAFYGLFTLAVARSPSPNMPLRPWRAMACSPRRVRRCSASVPALPWSASKV
ncbi:hypothetical protein P0F65_10015 [Sphingomonas sp. I4]